MRLAYLVGRCGAAEELEILAKALQSFWWYAVPKRCVDDSRIHGVNTDTVLRSLAQDGEDGIGLGESL